MNLKLFNFLLVGINSSSRRFFNFFKVGKALGFGKQTSFKELLPSLLLEARNFPNLKQILILTTWNSWVKFLWVPLAIPFLG